MQSKILASHFDSHCILRATVLSAFIMVASFLFSLLLVHSAYALGPASGTSSCSNSAVNSTAKYIPSFDLPTIYASSSSGQDAAAASEIRNTLALYILAIDGKNFDALSEVFTENIVANYTTVLGVMTSIPAISTGVETVLKYVTTQHQLGTQAIDVKEDSCDARSVTYFIASHFGQKKYANQVCRVPLISALTCHGGRLTEMCSFSLFTGNFRTRW